MRGISIGAVSVVVGVVVAAVNDYVDDLDTLKRVCEALIAVLIWPLILSGVAVNLSSLRPPCTRGAPRGRCRRRS
jgi:hypothetical protein